MSATRRIRVLQVLPALYHGGAENVAEILATTVDPTRFEMSVCCTRALGPIADRIQAAGIPVERSGTYDHPAPLRSVWQLSRVIKRLEPDVIHTHGITSMFEVGPLKVLKAINRWVHTYHYGNYPYKNPRHMFGERMFSKLPDQLVAVAEKQRRAIIDLHRVSPEGIITVPNGVRDNPYLGDAELRARKRTELGLDSSDRVIGTVAVLTEQKGVSFLLQAARDIVPREPRAKVVIVGGGPLEEPLRRQAVELGIADAVVFAGWRADVAELLPAFDIFVMSSLWEAMPLALLEAMVAQLPIVVTEVGDNRSIVEDGAAAVVVPSKSSEAIASAVVRLLQDRALSQSLGVAARQRWQRDFSTARMSANYAAIYAGDLPETVAA